MRAGTLRHRLTLQESSSTADTYGQMVKTWAKVADIWGSVRPLSGREYMAAKQSLASTTHQVTIRYRADVDTGMRIKFGSRYLNIDGIANTDERNKELILSCTEMA